MDQRQREEWRDLTRRYAAAQRRRWAAVNLPDDEREHVENEGEPLALLPWEDENLARTVQEAWLEANRTGAVAEFRREVPPHVAMVFPFMREATPESGPQRLVWLPDGRIAVQLGSLRKPDQLRWVAINSDRVEDLPGIVALGRSTDHRYLAVGRDSGIEIQSAFGEVVAWYAWPQPYHPQGRAGDDGRLEDTVIDLIPCRDGRRVIVVALHSVTRLGGRGVELIDGEGGAFGPKVALSPDDDLLAVTTYGTRRIYRGEPARLAAELGWWFGIGSGPGGFSADGRVLAFNGSRVYSGTMYGVEVGSLDQFAPGRFVPPTDGLRELGGELPPGVVCYDEFGKPGFAVPHRDGFVLAGHDSTITGVSLEGRHLWRHTAPGKSVTGIDIAVDGSQLAVASSRQLVVVFDLDVLAPGVVDEFSPGTSPHREAYRWFFDPTHGPIHW